MIKEKQKLSGNLGAKQSLNGSLNNSVIYVDPITQEKEVTPTKEIQEIVPDTGYTGLSKVKVKGYIANVAKKIIKRNGLYKSDDEGLDGYSEVSVETEGVDLTEYFNPTLTGGSYASPGICSSIKKISNNVVISGTSANYLFAGCKNLTEIPLLDTSNIKYMNNMFLNCSSLTTIPALDTHNATTMENMFQGCSNLSSIPTLDTSNVRAINYMFNGCSNLKTIPLLDISKATQMQHIFSGCRMLQEIPQLNTSNVTSFYNAFGSCVNLTTIPLLNASKVNYVMASLISATKLTNFGGFENLGMAYSTSQSANYSIYSLEVYTCSELTHDSLVSIINNLYDIKTKGCNTQKLAIGNVNIAKLTAEEIAIATEKGWTIV